jgi:Ca-activated chloride channel family protein
MKRLLMNPALLTLKSSLNHPLHALTYACILSISSLGSFGCSRDSDGANSGFNDHYGYVSTQSERSRPSSPSVDQNDEMDQIEYNPEVDASEDHLITFAVDVDTASYSIMRGSIEQGSLPAPSSVRVEEYINYFDYKYPAPDNLDDAPFAVYMESSNSPFESNKRLVRIGIKGYEVDADQRPPANLVFLLDVSGSMHSANKLGLLKESMSLMLDNLNPTDTISMVTYASGSRVVLNPTPVHNADQIINAIEGLQAGGGTNGAGGIRSAYNLAESAFVEEGINRVILCTDGDFNVGVTGDELYALIEEERERGITLSVFGFGSLGAYNDEQMEQLADRGNGNYTFIDSIREARRAVVDRLTSTIMVIAKDVKIQLEVNPLLIKTYRLLGYENRAIADQDFRNDQVDAGQIGAGHTVTALVEIELFNQEERPSVEELNIVFTEPHPSSENMPSIDPVEDVPSEDVPSEDAPSEDAPSEDAPSEDAPSEDAPSEELTDLNTTPAPLEIDALFAQDNAPLALLRLRAKTPNATAEDEAVEYQFVLNQDDHYDDINHASASLRFASAVAEFAEILRLSPHVHEINFDRIHELASSSVVRGDEFMAEFLTLVETTKSLWETQETQVSE